jgi:hypothetical protein
LTPADNGGAYVLDLTKEAMMVTITIKADWKRKSVGRIFAAQGFASEKGRERNRVGRKGG